MAVYGYVRVSTLAQVEEGQSLGVQERQIRGHAQILGLEVDRVFVEEGVSGSKPLKLRPQGVALLTALQPGDTIITAKLDRMFRSALDALEVLGELKERSVALHMIDLGGDVTGNGISKLVFTILSAVAEAERDRIRERITTVKRDQKARKRFLGGSVPFGYRVVEGELIPHAKEQAALVEARQMREAGASLRAVASALQAKGFALSHVTVKSALAGLKG